MKGIFANFLFLRAWLGIVLGIVLTALLLDLFLASRSTTDSDEALIQPYRPLLALLSSQLVSLPEDDRQAALEHLAAQWNIPAQLIPLSAFAGLAPLQEQQVSLYYNTEDQAMLYQQLGNTELLLALGPIPGAEPRLHDTWIISAYYLLVALILLLWIGPFSRDLSLLREAAASFGKADFSGRLQLRENSSILPVARSFNAMAERIEYLVSAHRELTHAVSHELRTPLARFKFSMEILARNDEAAKKQHYLEQMKGDVQELEALIDELLTYARLGEHNLQMDLQTLDVKTWLERELRVYLNTNQNTPIQVSCSFASHRPDAGFSAQANPDLLARALHNIIRNALRYSHEQICIHLQCNDMMCLRICDDGPGIPADKQHTIFEPFSRLETSRDRSSGGYGLGLAIAARILERHGGNISVHNCEPHGACFTLQWPRSKQGS